MKENLQVLIAGRSKEDLQLLEALLRKQPGIAVTTRLITNGHIDPLYGVVTMPELLVLSLSHYWEEELKALAERPAASRPPVIVVGPGNDVQVMRKAMQAGARDFFTRPAPEQEFAAVVQQVFKDRFAGAGSSTTRLTAVVNAKGGSGATVLACNLAHIMAVEAKQKVALLDLDIQFGTLPLYFDLKSGHSLLDALEVVADLDSTALTGFMTKHASGVHLLGAMTDRIVLPGDISAKRLGLLMELLTQGYQQVVVDLPRQIDSLTGMVMERADQIVIVMQQSLTHVRDAKRLMSILKDGLAIADERITVAVNRYDPKNRIGINDIQQTLDHRSLELIPNDFKRAAESVNLGIPLHDYAQTAPITRSIADLATKLSGRSPERKKGLFGRAFASFF